MLQNLREHITGWIAGVFIVLLAGSFVLFGIEYYVQGSSGDNAVLATVNGEKITERQFNNVYHQLLRQQRMANKGQPFPPGFTEQLKQYTLQSLINNTALNLAAKEMGFAASIDQAKQEVVSAKQFQEDGQFSEERLQQFLYVYNLSPEQFFTQLRQSIVSNQIANGIQGSAFVLANEMLDYYQMAFQKRSFGYFLISSKPFAAKVTLSEQQLQAYYQQNKDAFKTPEKVQLDYLLLSPTELAKTVSVSDKEVQQYYQGNEANFTVPKRWKVANYTVKLAANADKNAISMAKKQAEDYYAKAQKGALFDQSNAEWLAQDQLPGPLASIIDQLKPGQISKPFRTAQGFTLVKLVEVSQKRVKPFSEVEANVKKLLQHQKVQQLLNEKSDQLSNLTYTNPNTLKIAAKALKIKVNQSELLTRQGAKKGIFANQDVMRAAYSDEVLKQGNNSTPISLKDGSLIVLRVAKHLPSTVQPFAEIKNTLKQKLTQSRAQREAGLLAYKIQTAFKEGKTVKQIANKYNLNWIVKDNVLRTDKKIDPVILQVAFSSPEATQKESSPAKTVSLKQGDFAVVRLISVQKEVGAIPEKQKQLLKAQLQRYQAQMQYQLFVRSIIDSAKIKKNKTKI